MIKVKTQTGPFLNIKHMVQKLQTETFLSLYKCISSAEFSDFFFIVLWFLFCFGFGPQDNYLHKFNADVIIHIQMYPYIFLYMYRYTQTCLLFIQI